MKQRKVVSMIGALILIIGAVALITGCPQANGNKDNTTINNSSNNLNGTAWMEKFMRWIPVNGKNPFQVLIQVIITRHMMVQ